MRPRPRHVLHGYRRPPEAGTARATRARSGICNRIRKWATLAMCPLRLRSLSSPRWSRRVRFRRVLAPRAAAAPRIAARPRQARARWRSTLSSVRCACLRSAALTLRAVRQALKSVPPGGAATLETLKKVRSRSAAPSAACAPPRGRAQRRCPRRAMARGCKTLWALNALGTARRAHASAGVGRPHPRLPRTQRTPFGRRAARHALLAPAGPCFWRAPTRPFRLRARVHRSRPRARLRR